MIFDFCRPVLWVLGFGYCVCFWWGCACVFGCFILTEFGCDRSPALSGPSAKFWGGCCFIFYCVVFFDRIFIRDYCVMILLCCRPRYCVVLLRTLYMRLS